MKGAKFSLRLRFLVAARTVEKRIFDWFYRDPTDEIIEVDGWRFAMYYGFIYLQESVKDWQYYLPPGGVEGKTVLDLGGGCGETAKFFLDHGAKKVIVVEPNPLCFDFLDYNAERHEELVVLKEKAKLPHLGLVCDLVKMDIEGYEAMFLPYLDDLNIDIVLEAHSNYIVDQFLLRGFKPFKPWSRDREIFGRVDQLYRWKKDQ